MSGIGNYRPVSLATINSKYFESSFYPATHHLMPSLTTNLELNMTLTCTFLLKSVVSYIYFGSI